MYSRLMLHTYSDRERAMIAAALGHERPQVIRTRRGNYRFECACGFLSESHADQGRAIRAGIRHFHNVTTAAIERAGGGSAEQIAARALRARAVA